MDTESREEQKVLQEYMEKRRELQRHINHQMAWKSKTRQGLPGFFMPLVNSSLHPDIHHSAHSSHLKL